MPSNVSLQHMQTIPTTGLSRNRQTTRDRKSTSNTAQMRRRKEAWNNDGDQSSSDEDDESYQSDGDESNEFQNLARSVHNNKTTSRPSTAKAASRPQSARMERARPTSARPATNNIMSARPSNRSSNNRNSNQDGNNNNQAELLSKVNALEKDIKTLRSSQTLDSNLNSKLNELKLAQANNKRVIAQLTFERDTAEAKGRRLEKALVDDDNYDDNDEGGFDATGPKQSHRPKPIRLSTSKPNNMKNSSSSVHNQKMKTRQSSSVQPFACMEIHESLRRRKQIKADQVRQDELDEEIALNYKDQQRLLRSMEAKEFSFARQDAIKQAHKHNLQQSKSNPNNSTAHIQFKARPIKLYHTSSWVDIAAKQTAERLQRVAFRAAKMQSLSHLPARMAMYESVKLQDGYNERVSSSEKTRVKLEKEGVKRDFVKSVVDNKNYTVEMEREQRRWESQLEEGRKKVRVHSTVPYRELPIEVRQREHKVKQRAREEKNRLKEEDRIGELKELERRKQEKAINAKVEPPRMTKGYRIKVNKLKEMKDEEIVKGERLRKDEARRRKKQDIVNREVKQMVSEMDRERKAAYPGTFIELNSESEERAHEKTMAKNKEFHQRQRELKERLLQVQVKHKAAGGIIGATEKVSNMKKAKRRALGVVADAVYSGGYGGGGRGEKKDWHARASSDDLFDDDEKAYLGYGGTY